MNWYAYVGNNPVVWVDPYGLLTIPGVSGDPWLVFDAGSWDQLGMSAAATAGGAVAGLTGGLLSPNWRNSCDQWGDFSSAMGFASGAVLGVVASNPDATLASFEGRFGRYIRATPHPLSPEVLKPTGVPGRLAGRLHQARERIPHLNIGDWHMVVNRYNWYKPWRWFVR
jgi:hypothetical protein